MFKNIVYTPCSLIASIKKIPDLLGWIDYELCNILGTDMSF